MLWFKLSKSGCSPISEACADGTEPKPSTIRMASMWISEQNITWQQPLCVQASGVPENPHSVDQIQPTFDAQKQSRWHIVTLHTHVQNHFSCYLVVVYDGAIRSNRSPYSRPLGALGSYDFPTSRIIRVSPNMVDSPKLHKTSICSYIFMGKYLHQPLFFDDLYYCIRTIAIIGLLGLPLFISWITTMIINHCLWHNHCNHWITHSQVVCDYLGPLAGGHQRPMPWEEAGGTVGPGLVLVLDLGMHPR